MSCRLHCALLAYVFCVVENKRPVNIVRCVPSGPIILGSANTAQFPRKPVIIRQLKGPTAESVTCTGVSTITLPPHTIRVTKLAPGKGPHLPLPVITRIIPATPTVAAGAPPQIPSSKLIDSQLASQLDGIFSKQVSDSLCFSILFEVVQAALAKLHK